MATSSTSTTITSSLFLLSPSFNTFNKTPHKSNLSNHKKSSYYQPPISIFTLSNQTTIKLTQNPYQRLNLFIKNHKKFRVLAVEDTTNIVSSEDTTQQIVSVTSDSNSDVTSTVITVLLSIAFVALTVLTIGVIYISVTDFLQKREKEKFEKEEEEAKKKKGGKKVRARSRAGPRGFGQKIDVDEDDD